MGTRGCQEPGQHNAEQELCEISVHIHTFPHIFGALTLINSQLGRGRRGHPFSSELNWHVLLGGYSFLSSFFFLSPYSPRSGVKVSAKCVLKMLFETFTAVCHNLAHTFRT